MSALPAQYAWLNEIGQLPRTIQEGLKLLGTKEVPGKGDSPEIMSWMDELGEDVLGYRYTGDAVPWCGGYAAIVAKRAGKSVPFGPLYALNWSKFGDPVGSRAKLDVRNPMIFVDSRTPSLGDVLVFRREGGGHVGFYIGEDRDAYCVLGGNQGDAVTITWIAKARCVAVRRPKYTNPPASVRPYSLKRTGALSQNEA